MKKSLQILCSAQHFGYGPMAELIALARTIRHTNQDVPIKLLIHRNKALTELWRGIEDCFELFDAPEGMLPLEIFFNNPLFTQVDAILSSFDSASVFYGWFYDIPVFLYDGLFWFWKFDDYRDSVGEYLILLNEIRERQDINEFVAVYRKLLKIDYHLTMLVAYHLCTSAFVRDGAEIKNRLIAFDEFAHKIQTVGAVIDPTVNSENHHERTHFLVSLSGSLAPLLSFEQNLIFARGTLMFAIEAMANIEIKLPWYFCCHPKLYNVLAEEGLLRNLPQMFFVTKSFNYCTNLEMIRKAYALFISPGFSTIQEAAYFQTPVFFLPEQNGSQPAQLLMLRNAGYNVSPNWTVTDVIYGGNCKIGENDIELLYKGINMLWGEQMQNSRTDSLNHFNEILLNKKQRYSLIESQNKATRKVFRDFDGAKQVISKFGSELKVMLK